jgi:hypothetical protein
MARVKQGTRVEFDVQSIKGKGTIVGVATVELPFIGASYIIEPDQKIENETYNYTHFVASESQFKTL